MILDADESEKSSACPALSQPLNIPQIRRGKGFYRLLAVSGFHFFLAVFLAEDSVMPVTA